jgi:emericellamide synthase (highly reducing iterative type I polyketide synthase)
MTYEQWIGAIDPKIKGTWNLHTQLPANLDFFIMLSSAVAVSGNVGQSNYAAGCSFQDSLACFRRNRGLPAHSINVGAAGEAGFVSENTDVAATLRKQGFGTMSVAELLGHLDHLITDPPNEPRKSQTILGLLPSGNEVGLGESVWMNDTKFVHVRRQGSARSQMLGAESGALAAISSAAHMEEATDIICKAIVGQLSKMIGIPIDHINTSKSLDHYGVDSLVAVELRNWIGAYIKANVPLMVLRSTESIQALAELVTKESRLVDDTIKAAAPQE